MINELGKELRKLRIDKGEVLKNMADNLHITSAYLSAIECGKRDIPDWFIPRLEQTYNLNEEQINTFKEAYDKSLKSIELNFINASEEQREIALKFARTFKDMDTERLKAFQDFLNGEN